MAYKIFIDGKEGTTGLKIFERFANRNDIELITMNRSEKYAFLNAVEENGIMIHQPPFFGNTTEEQFKEIFKEHPEWCTEYDFEGIERPMTMGDVYFIRLKHEPSNKSSMRSAANLNVKNLPAKSTLKKEKRLLP